VCSPARPVWCNYALRMRNNPLLLPLISVKKRLRMYAIPCPMARSFAWARFAIAYPQRRIGIEEAEKMERPFFQRWPSEHPVLFGFLMSVLASILTLSASKILDAFLKSRG